MSDKKRTPAQAAADGRYEPKRANDPRFGGRCKNDEKELLTRLASEEGLSEKELIFKAVRFFDKNR
ncbi:hypothetical protein [Shewanella colwelliana]|uniref:hypothetical protein n=1 Tax=Shewanella colwelliana TaxID=23 RepID=UPI0022AF1C13|nr:hypothetical protein [Shewanella colwelliana]MCZ4337657.1 hypothetical protein [Shewanella colwelliana]